MAESHVLRPDHFKTLTTANLNFEICRLRTFKSWFMSLIVSAEELARAGFYYRENENKIICYSCNSWMIRWTIGVVALEEHYRMWPYCSFLNGIAGNVPVDHLLLDVNARLETFTGRWTLNFIDPVDLANSGFYYFGVSDQVQCAFCFGILMNWKQEDKPHIDHKMYFPSCKFFKSNIAHTSPVNFQGGSISSYFIERLYFSNSFPKRGRRKLPLDDTTILYYFSVCDFSVCDKSQSDEQVKQLMKNENERLKTFAEWPVEFISPVSLAESGFYYVGWGETVICAYCSHGFKKWRVNDEPNVRHRRFFPWCPFVKSGSQKNSTVTMRQDVCGVEVKDERVFPIPRNNELKKKSKPSSRGLLPDREKATKEELKFLKDDLQKLKNQALCKICMNDEIDVVIIPCGHLVTCACCSQNIDVCPVCRKTVENIIRTFKT